MLSTLLLLSISVQAHSEVINKVLAYVGSQAITLYDVQSLNPTEYQRILAIEDATERNTLLKEYESQALEFLINQHIIVVAAEREGIIVKDEEIDAAIAEVAARSEVSVDELAGLVAQEGLSLPMYRSQIMTDILNARVRMQVLMPKTVISEKDLQDMVDSNPDEYQLYDKYNVRMLMTNSEADLNNALNEIKQGITFSEAVEKYSVDGSVSNDGKLGWLEADLLSENMKKALISSKVGNITTPFEVNGKWAVFMVDEFQSKYDFDEETRQQLEEEISEDIFTKVFTNWLEKNRETIVVMRAEDMF